MNCQSGGGHRGLYMKICKADVRPGGKFHYLMTNEPDSSQQFEMWGAFDYLEVETHQHIVFVNYFSDSDGGKTRHHMNLGVAAGGKEQTYFC